MVRDLNKNFEFYCDLAKAEKDGEGKLYLCGVASTTGVDLQKEKMEPSALQDMVKTAVGKPLTNSHKNELENNIGTIVDARIEDNALVIKAEVDDDDPVAVRLWKKVKRGAKAAFSVGGRITSDRPGTERGVKRVITGVEINHIMATSSPANAQTFAFALSKAMEDLDVADLAEITDLAKDMSSQDRDKYACYQENGVGKFPIRPGNSGDAESALHLLGHAPESEQHAILERACSILGDKHPRCKQFYATNKTGDTMENQDPLAKAGAQFSAESKSALKEIHDAGSADVKAKVRSLLGDDADTVLNVQNEESDTDGDNDGDKAPASGTTGGVVSKTTDKPIVVNQVSKTELSAEQIATLHTEVVKELKLSVQDIVKELLKTAPKTETHEDSLVQDTTSAFAQMLGKSIRL